ncbi:DNA repair protein RadC [Clostridium manihotivorum]|uniref:DNA repair protein RadC n=2 Tax=Clostridium manihotivorum TaxID=2320868 RepID=A0A3R5TJX0_9CLOT|nr:DNA repair protein RadC [Clostridium manihotivorum]
MNKNETIMDLNVNPQEKGASSKRVNIISIKMVKEGSLLYSNRNINSPDDAADLLSPFLQDSDREMLVVCCLDSKNQPTLINIASIGTLNSSLVHPREVFKAAILGNAASVIIAHNHPSGDPSPSSEDINITTRLKEAGKIIGIDVLDHVIIGFSNHVSLKERGVI